MLRLLLLLALLLPASLIAQRPVPWHVQVDWTPPEWTQNPAISAHANLIELLNGLAEAARDYDELTFLEVHFTSMRALIEDYPPSAEQTAALIENYRDPNRGASLRNYVDGAQLIISYDSTAGGQRSYVRYVLPTGWEPGSEFPVFAWARGGGPNPYPGDIVSTVYPGQIKNEVIEGTPSGVFRIGFTIMPGALGGRAYTGNEEADFIQGMQAFQALFTTDKKRYYMGGFSNGGKATYLIGARTMDIFNWAALGFAAAAVNLSADSHSEAYAAPLVNTPIWMAVGANDSQWIGRSRGLRDLFTAIGNPPEVYYEAPGIGHDWTWDFQDGMFKFFQTKRYQAPGAPAAAPTTPQAMALSPYVVELSWTPGDASSSVIVEREDKGNGIFRKIALVAAGTTAFTDEPLQPATDYKYRLVATADSGDAPATIAVSVTTPAPTAPLVNVAIGAIISDASEANETLERLFDGNTTTEVLARWSARGFPQSVEIDLGRVRELRRSHLFPSLSRDYRYLIEAKGRASDPYTTIADRSDNTESTAILSDQLEVEARFLRLTVTGAATYPADWIGIGEWQVFALADPSEWPAQITLDLSSQPERLKIDATGPVSTRLEMSEDLATWSEIEHFEIDAGESRLVDAPPATDPEPGAPRFYRLAVP